MIEKIKRVYKSPVFLKFIKLLFCLKLTVFTTFVFICCNPTVNESAEAVIRHNIFIHKNIARVTADDIVELVADDILTNQEQDKLMTSAAQEMMVCLYRNQLLNVFVRVALIAIPINSCVRDKLPLGMQFTYTSLI